MTVIPILVTETLLMVADGGNLRKSYGYTTTKNWRLLFNLGDLAALNIKLLHLLILQQRV